MKGCAALIVVILILLLISTISRWGAENDNAKCRKVGYEGASTFKEATYCWKILDNGKRLLVPYDITPQEK